jgi:hypothetical protein
LGHSTQRIEPSKNPGQFSIRLDNDQPAAPFREPSTSQDPIPTIHIANSGSDLTALENDELVPAAEIFGSESCFGFEDGDEGEGKAPNHQ